MSNLYLTSEHQSTKMPVLHPSFAKDSFSLRTYVLKKLIYRKERQLETEHQNLVDNEFLQLMDQFASNIEEMINDIDKENQKEDKRKKTSKKRKIKILAPPAKRNKN